jgi:polysaccharide export outer membrane protein
MSRLRKHFHDSAEHGVRQSVPVRPALLAGLLGLTAALCTGCQTSPPSFPSAAAQDFRAANYSTNLLQEGDVVSVDFQYSTNFSTLQKISMDGSLIMNSVGAVKAAGKTVEELQAEIVKLYKPQIKDDVVTVKLVSAASSLYISGAVVRPGKIAMDRPMTALEGIMEAGGWDPSRAKLSDVIVLRLDDGKQKKFKLDLNKTLQGRDPEPFYLKPFDIIYVPLKTFNY